MTLNELIEKEEKIIRSRANEIVNAAFSPRFPVSVQLYVNDFDSAKQIIVNGLARYWGNEYAKDIDIHQVEMSSCIDWNNQYQALHGSISNLLSKNNTFQSLTSILLFDVVKCSCFTSIEEFADYYNSCIRYTYDDNHSINRILVLIIDKNPIENDIVLLTNEIERYVQKNNGYSSAIFLSNQLDNGGIIQPDNMIRYRILSTIIALTNRLDNPSFWSTLFNEEPRYLTVGYVHKEKPVHLVTVYTLYALLKRINERFSDSASTVSVEQLTRTFVDPCFELGVKHFNKADYPDIQCMEFFPYRDNMLASIIEQDKIWRIFFDNNFKRKAEEKADEHYEMVCEEFLKILLSQFTHQQLHYLLNHEDVLNQFWSIITNSPSSRRLFTYEWAIAEAKLIYSNHLVLKLQESIRSILERAQMMSNELADLQTQMGQIIFPISNFDSLTDSIKDFYDKEIVSPYIEKHWQELRMQFSMRDTSDINVFEILEDHMNRIINSNSIFSSSFEGELTQRMGIISENARAADKISTFIMEDDSRERFYPHVKIKSEAYEIYLLPENASYVSLIKEKMEDTDHIMLIPTDQYIERISLFFIYSEEK